MPDVAAAPGRQPSHAFSQLPAVVCRGLTQRFGGKAAVEGLDLEVRHGEVFGLLGPNGAGKTTTIRLINTLLPVREGRVEVFGFDVVRSPMAARRLMGYVPQALSIEAALDGTGERDVVCPPLRHPPPRA